ncbi:MAG: AAA family ATPase [Actinomycetota bacterium]
MSLESLFTNVDVTSQPQTVSTGFGDYHKLMASLCESGLLQTLYDGTFEHATASGFPIDSDGLFTSFEIHRYLPLGTVIQRSVERSASTHILARGGDWIAHVSAADSRMRVTCAAVSIPRAESIIAMLQSAFEFHDNDSGKVHFGMWTSTDWMPDTRVLDETPWTDVRRNYPARTGDALDHLMAVTGPESRNGRVVLWHGPPGTGKTWALRSLMSTWKWCHFEIVLDPDAFMGSTEYLMRVLNSDSHGAKPRIIVMEDVDNLVQNLTVRSSGLGRMLNLADGILGQTQDIVVLLTTNAAPRDLDPALTRPGRCLAVIDFAKFSAAEARTRIDNVGVAIPASMSLAEIFRATGATTQISPASEGFGGAGYL